MSLEEGGNNEGVGEVPDQGLESSTSSSSVTPTNPIMGIFAEQDPPGSNKWNIRMGGKPNADWTGLDPDQVFRTTPFHFRRPEMTSDSKGYLIRSTGLT